MNFFPPQSKIDSYEIFMRTVQTRVRVEKLNVFTLVFCGIEIIKWNRRKVNTRLSI